MFTARYGRNNLTMICKLKKNLPAMVVPEFLTQRQMEHALQKVQNHSSSSRNANGNLQQTFNPLCADFEHRNVKGCTCRAYLSNQT